MARYDVFPTRIDDATPYLLDVQSDLLMAFNTRVVVPLVRSSALRAAHKRLHPTFLVEGERVIMATHLLAAIAVAELRDPVATLEDAHFEIVNALDMLFQGL